MIPVTSGVISLSTSAGAMLSVNGSMSANTGSIRCHVKAWMVAENVNDGTITRPDMPNARIASSSAAVPLLVTTHSLAPATAATAASNSSTSGPPFVSHRRSNAALIRAISRRRSPILGQPTCNGSENAGGLPSIARLIMTLAVYENGEVASVGGVAEIMNDGAVPKVADSATLRTSVSGKEWFVS